MSAVGGLASVWGSIFGAATVVLLADLIRDQMNALFAGATGEAEIIVFGTLLVVIMVFMPEGLVVSGMKSFRRWQGRRRVSTGV
jgi:branched-chain amino acid transport system permease protein